MTIRFLSGSALAAALLAAPAAPAQVMQTRPVQTRPVQSRPATQAPLPSGVVLRPGERLVSPAAPPQSSGVVTLGGVQPSGGRYVTQTSGTVPMTTRPMTSQPMAARPMTTQPMATQTSMMSGGDQARAQAEANMMASRGIRGHVGGTIGAFEGVGWSAGGTPNTCTPGRPMRLTADAIARGPGGVYRVRAWR